MHQILSGFNGDSVLLFFPLILAYIMKTLLEAKFEP